MIPVLLVAALAGAVDGEPEDLRVEVASGAVVNWTALVLEVGASARGGATESTQAVEELARRDADAGIRQGVARIAVTSERTVGDLQKVPEFSGALDGRIARWRAAETRYHRSGRVEIDAVISLIDLLKPYTLATARPSEPDGPQPRYTGLVLDARGTPATPCWAPRILSSKGEVLYGGFVWEEAAVDGAPVIYVSDPAHPASTRAGEDPIFLRASSSEGPDLVLTPEDTQRFRTSLGNARFLGEGRIVVVVDP